MVPFVPSPSGIATGEAEAVGFKCFAATKTHPPFRIFYPAAKSIRGKAVGFFQDSSSALFLQGYWNIIIGRKRYSLLYNIGMVFFEWLAWVLPISYLKIPGVFLDAPVCATSPKLPLILFSHGDGCTGQESSTLLSAWAKQGYVVVSVQHTDGSSNHVRLADGSILWKDPGPPLDNYDANFRPTQIEKRVKDLVMVQDWLLSNHHREIPDLSCKVDWHKTICAGYSYGAATTALVAAKGILPSLQAVILLDGWFYVDIVKSKLPIEFLFPKQAFEEANASHLKEIPAVLVNSEAFEKELPKLWKATKQLAARFDADPPHVIPQTRHVNFCDLMFWFPAFVLKRLGAPPGPAEPVKAYKDIVNLTIDFLKQQQTKSSLE